MICRIDCSCSPFELLRINSNSKYEEKVKRKKSDGFDAWSSKLKSDLETKREKQSEIFSLYYFD